MVTIIITSYNEPDSIQKALECIIDPEYSGLNVDYELLTVIPDQETIDSAQKIITKFSVKNWKNIKDPLKGKPYAINLALKEAKGDILMFTDGDVYFGKDSVRNLLSAFSDDNVGGVTGRPVSMDEKHNFMGYIGHLLADAAHHKRMVTMRADVAGKSLKFVSKAPYFFVLSGYIFAMRNYGLTVPDDTLIEDAYLSYELFNKGHNLAYEPEAKVYVKYAKSVKDWYKQKLRSVGGYVQLWKYGIIKQETEVRSFWKELQYIWFPIRYAKNLNEYFWSLLLYPMRFWLWLKIFIDQRILKKDLIGKTGWERIESTK